VLAGSLDWLSSGSEAWSRLVSWLVSACVVLGIAYVLAWFTWFWWPAGDQPAAPAETVNSRSEPLAAVNRAETVAGLYMFGKAQKRRAPPPAKAEAPVTRLALELKGLVAGADGKVGGAIIADKEGDRFFLVGATLPGDVVLDEVYARKVVLLRNGRQETLKLVRDLLGEASGSKGNALDPRGADAAHGRRSPPTGQRAPSRGSTAPGSINKAIRIRPIMRGGKVKGFRVSPGRNRKVFAGMGFRTGDLLTKLNGVVPSDPKEVFAVLNQLGSGGVATAEVTRRGRPITLEIRAP